MPLWLPDQRFCPWTPLGAPPPDPPPFRRNRRHCTARYALWQRGWLAGRVSDTLRYECLLNIYRVLGWCVWAGEAAWCHRDWGSPLVYCWRCSVGILGDLALQKTWNFYVQTCSFYCILSSWFWAWYRPADIAESVEISPKFLASFDQIPRAALEFGWHNSRTSSRRYFGLQNHEIGVCRKTGNEWMFRTFFYFTRRPIRANLVSADG